MVMFVFFLYIHQPLRYHLYAQSFTVGPFQVGAIRLFCLPGPDKVVSITRRRGNIWRDILFYFVLFKWRKDEDISDWQGLLLRAVGPNVPHLRFSSNTNRYVRTVHLTVSSLHQLSTTWKFLSIQHSMNKTVPRHLLKPVSGGDGTFSIHHLQLRASLPSLKPHQTSEVVSWYYHYNFQLLRKECELSVTSYIL